MPLSSSYAHNNISKDFAILYQISKKTIIWQIKLDATPNKKL